MTALVWDKPGERTYQSGIDRGVLYLRDGTAVVWNGLTSVEENRSNELKSFFIHGVKYLEYISPGDFSATLKAFTYPDEFDSINGVVKLSSGLHVHDQPPKSFCLSYRTKIGTDLDEDEAYIIHLLYNVLANPEAFQFSSISDQVQPIEFGWSLSAVPVRGSNINWKPTAHISIDSRDISPSILQSLEETLYGTVSTSPSFPTIDEILLLFGQIVDYLEVSDFPTQPLRLYNLIGVDPTQDLGSQNKDLTLIGSPTSTSENGMSFDGLTQYATADVTGLPTNASPQSYGVRFRTDLNSSDWPALFTWLGAHGLWLTDRTLYIANDSGGIYTGILSDDNWHLVVVTVDDDALDGEKTKVYVDGDFFDSSPENVSDVTYDPEDPWHLLVVMGADYNGTPLFEGYLKDMFVCDYVLTPTQIAALQTKVSL